MSIPALTLREMVVSVLQGNNEQPLKPSEIAAMIKERYPDYCAQKAAATTQNNFNVVAQIASEISANSKQWMQRHQQLKSSDETPRTYWWEAQDTDSSGQEVDVPQRPSSVPTPASTDEQSLYPKLAAYLSGMKARKLYPKRIDEKTSSNTNGSNGNKALHPDVVALEDLMPQPTWSSEMKEWATKSGAPQAKLWSFEVKVKISSISDARESYLQALANSAWANYGYLVAAHISDKAFNELKTLADLHGVGVILLDIDNPVDESTVKLLRIPPQYHHPFRSKPCQRFRTKPATRSTRNPTARSNPKSATHSKTNPPRRRVDVEGLRTSGRGQFPTALFAHRLAFEFQPMRSADQAIKDRVSYRRIAAAQIVMPAINR